MTPERYEKSCRLYDGALEIKPEARNAFLETECAGDEELRREVESLLAAHERVGNYFASPALEVAAGFVAKQENLSLAGKSFLHYRMLSLIGAGGMGEVHLAEDTRLRRKVALKILPKESTQDNDRVRRFEQEARAASALNHPNIVTIYEVGQIDGRHFIAAEYIEGQTLRERLNSRELTLGEALEIGAQTANALETAHEAGIVHRDIKPENIMLRPDGYIKVLDFGLAKLTESGPHSKGSDLIAQVDTETSPGLVVGTLSYMSPEQARGERLDARTDIFSLGVMLYEMIAGRRPFEGRTTGEVLAAVLTKEPEPLEERRNEVGTELEQSVMRCLAKDREKRFQTARELAVDLKAIQDREQQTTIGSKRRESRTFLGWRAFWIVATLAFLLIAAAFYWKLPQRGATDPPITSLAVLPLENLSGDVAKEYFADGMTDALIGELTKVGALRVISRTSAMRYKGIKKSLPEIARELSVDAVIEGTVQLLGDRVRVRAQLVRASTEQALWSRNWDHDLRDVLSLQSEIAQAVVREVQIKLRPEEQIRLTSARRVNAEAYQEYLKGLFYTNQGINSTSCQDAEELHKKSFGFFEQAIKIDPEYAQAHLGLGASYHWLASCDESFRHLYHKARTAVEQALALDETLAEAHGSLAFILANFEGDLQGAEREYKRALELGSSSGIHAGYGLYLSAVGRHTEAIAEMKQAQEMDPLTLPIKGNLGVIYVQARQYDLAIEQFRHLLDLVPNDPWARVHLGSAYIYQHRFDEGLAEIQKVTEARATVRDHYSRSSLAWAYAASGKPGQAKKLLDELRAHAQQSVILKVVRARTYAMLGETDQAMDWLERAFQDRPRAVRHVNKLPEFDSLRSHPRYIELMRKMHSVP